MLEEDVCMVEKVEVLEDKEAAQVENVEDSVVKEEWVECHRS